MYLSRKSSVSWFVVRENEILTGGNGAASFYAPALSTLGVGGRWSDYTAEIHSSSPYGIGLQDANVIVDGEIYSGQGLVLVITGTTSLQGNGQTLTPNFAGQATIAADDTAIQFGPAAVLTGALPMNSDYGLALPAYTGVLTIQQHSIDTDLVELAGSSNRDLALTVTPITSTLAPGDSTSFQATILSNQDDVYTTTAAAPIGWDVVLDNQGGITATLPLGVQPGDYPIQVVAQSTTAGTPIWAVAVHTVTVLPQEGVALTVSPDLLTTVPWAQTDFIFPGDDINNGQPQVSGAAFIATITNTSSAAHTYDIQVQPQGFASSWIMLGGAGRTATTQVALPAGGSGQIGVYISPEGLAALPAAGTSYPFDVVATAVENSELTAQDDEIFVMPEVQFAHVAAQPALVYSAPGESTAFEVTVTNVGNSTAPFSLTLDMPLSGWTSSPDWSNPTLSPGQSATEMITLTTNTGDLGQTYVVAASSQSGPYRPTAYVGVEIVSPEALPVRSGAVFRPPLWPVCDRATPRLPLPNHRQQRAILSKIRHRRWLVLARPSSLFAVWQQLGA